jgi:hypothetical protein
MKQSGPNSSPLLHKCVEERENMRQVSLHEPAVILEELDAKKLAPPPSVIIITPRPNQQAAGREAGVEAV